jgi:hypothetical protein
MKGDVIKKPPAYRIFSVMRSSTRSHWVEIGAAFAHRDGQGFNLQLNGRPLAGASLVLRARTATVHDLSEHP